MAVPKRKKSPSRRNMRRRHRMLKLPAVSSDSDGNMHLRHYATARRNDGQMSHENKPMSVVEGDLNG
ncbi:50S ribosomal protein L32 [Candidatus Tremblaya princeps]|uniref:Large ribosomal subunit protein bL32 n=1 Tax=Tremblaya princeps TaxID=189385 RepID=A0A143WMI4_TREPR|nr:50S ribosomal protein L32 [Candidatus Tremblaya princeps]